MNKSLKLIISIVVISFVVICVWWLWKSLQAAPLPTDFAEGNGRIEAVQIDISTKIAGRVEAVLAKEGDLVQAQQVLAKIESSQLLAQKLRAQADVASAISLVASAQATIAQAKAQLILAQQELSRTKELLKNGHVSNETFDVRNSNVSVAKANLEAAQAMLVAQSSNVDAARANVAEIQTLLDDTSLESPTIGRVLYRLAEPGEVLGSGGKVLTMINLSDVYMEVFLPTTEAHRVAIGAEARIKFDILDVAIPAQVTFVSPESQFTPKQVETQSEREKLMFRVKVRVPEELVLNYIDQVKTGVRGVAYIQLTPQPGEKSSPWPDFLQQLPSDATTSTVNLK